MAWAMLAASVLSAGAGIWSADKASKASQGGNAAALNQARDDRNLMLRMYEPQRQFGTQAMGDLATLYGYAMPRYQTADQLISGGGTAGPPMAGSGLGTNVGTGPNGQIVVKGRQQKNGMTDWSFGMWGGAKKKFGGSIDPTAGTVTIPGKAKKSEIATEYLRTGVAPKKMGGKFGRITKAVDALRGSGWEYDPNAATATPGPDTGGAGGTPTYTPEGYSQTGQAAGQPGNFSRFFTSPDYQFRLSEGQKALERSAAARGGLFSGAAGKAAIRFGQDTAASEYGNYFERLMRMAGMGGAATNSGANAVAGTSGAMQNHMVQSGDARASSYGAYNDVAQNTLNNWWYWRSRNGG